MAQQIKGGLMAQLDWPIKVGKARTCRFQVKRAGVPVASFAGYSFLGQARKRANVSSPQVGDNITFDLSEGTGWVTMELPGTVPVGEFYYEVDWIKPGETVPRPLFGGKLSVGSTVVEV